LCAVSFVGWPIQTSLLQKSLSWWTNLKARSAVRSAKLACDQVVEAAAHCAVDIVKRELGERGAVWWTDGAPDFNRHKVTNTPYAKWFSGLRAARRREEGP
jgi:hypothetical protein